MAGEKLSPRQQMIGLMYLVLTCMLALQVSSSILDKFIFLNASLEHSMVDAKRISDAALKDIEALADSMKTETAKERADLARDLGEKTEAMIARIDEIKQTLIADAGGGINPETGAINTPKEETKVEVYMVGPEGSKSGEGYKLEKELNDHVAYLNREFKSFLGAELLPLAVGNKDKEIYKGDPVQQNKDFSQASFSATPVVAALALLTQKQSELIRYEQEILKKLGATDDLSEAVSFDNIVAVAAVESSVLTPGDKFKADLFLAASASNIKPVVTFNGRPVKIEDGIGKVEMPVSGGSGKVKWKGNISFKNPKTKKQESYDVEGEYTVVEVTVNWQSGTLFPLYEACANPLTALAPALGAKFNPTFSASGARTIAGSKPGDVTIVPAAGTAGSTVNVSVSSGGKNLGSKEFRVQAVPNPAVVLANSSGKEIDTSRPIPVPSSLQIAAIPDKGFAQALPKEAVYRVTGLEVTQIRGGASVATKKFPSGTISMGQFSTRKGDSFQVKVSSVQRASTQSGLVPVPLKQNTISFVTR